MSPSLVRFYLLQQQRTPQQQQRHRQRRRIIMLSIDASCSALAWPPADLTGLFDFTPPGLSALPLVTQAAHTDGGNMIRPPCEWRRHLVEQPSIYQPMQRVHADKRRNRRRHVAALQADHRLDCKHLSLRCFSSSPASRHRVQIQGGLGCDGGGTTTGIATALVPANGGSCVAGISRCLLRPIGQPSDHCSIGWYPHMVGQHGP